MRAISKKSTSVFFLVEILPFYYTCRCLLFCEIDPKCGEPYVFTMAYISFSTVIGKNGSLFTSAQMAAAAASTTTNGLDLDGGMHLVHRRFSLCILENVSLIALYVQDGVGGTRLDSVGSLGMGDMNLESQMYTSTSLMATGNTHHIFDSTPPIQVREL